MKKYPDLQHDFELLPHNIQETIDNFDWANELLSIAHKYKIQIDELEKLHYETCRLILVKISHKEYISYIVEHLSLSYEVAESLAADVDARIFAELQKRAFGKSDTSKTQKAFHEEEDFVIKDPALENLLRQEGVLGEDPQALQGEIDENIPLKDDATDVTDASGLVEKRFSIVSEPVQYQEPIDELDLMGVRAHRIEHSLGKKKSSLVSKKDFFDTQIGVHRKKVDISPSKNKQDIEKKGFVKNLSDHLETKESAL